MSSPNITLLSPIALPLGSVCRRPPDRLPGHLTDVFAGNFDSRTLVYDAFFDRSCNAIRLICPKLLNLKKAVIQGGAILVDGIDCRPVLREFPRYDLLEVHCSTQPKEVVLSAFGMIIPISLSEYSPEVFDGRRVLYTMSRDNRIEWIEDWARHHIDHHGADALLLVDNGSRLYELWELVERLEQIDGLATIRVLSAPFRFGPYFSPSQLNVFQRLRLGGGSRFRFLQVAMLNLARIRFLSRAASVLSIDVDELVFSSDGESVFSKAESSPAGMVQFRGDWYLPPVGLRNPTHADHVFLRAGARRCPPKYCVSPLGPLGGRSWSVHTLDLPLCAFPFHCSDLRYRHMRGITSNWKGGRDY